MLVISHANDGLRLAILRMLGAAWQRCRYGRYRSAEKKHRVWSSSHALWQDAGHSERNASCCVARHRSLPGGASCYETSAYGTYSPA